jgi:hypothetical protein
MDLWFSTSTFARQVTNTRDSNYANAGHKNYTASASCADVNITATFIQSAPWRFCHRVVDDLVRGQRNEEVSAPANREAVYLQRDFRKALSLYEA